MQGQGRDKISCTKQNAPAMASFRGPTFDRFMPPQPPPARPRQQMAVLKVQAAWLSPAIGRHQRFLKKTPGVNRAQADLQQGTEHGDFPAVGAVTGSQICYVQSMGRPGSFGGAGTGLVFYFKNRRMSQAHLVVGKFCGVIKVLFYPGLTRKNQILIIL